MNILKRAAIRLLRKELQVDRMNMDKLQKANVVLTQRIQQLEKHVLDMNANKPNTVDVKEFRDMRLDADEKVFAEELAKNKLFAQILDKLSMRLIAGVVNRPTLPTEEDLKLIRGQVIAYNYLLSVIQGNVPTDKVNPLTGETEATE